MTAAVRKALYLAQRDVGVIAKDSTAKVQGESKKTGQRFEYTYAFTSSEDMLEHCRKALHEHGLSWEMVGYDVESPLPKFDCPTLVGRFELVHADSGEVLERVYKMPIASRNDPDKATSGAITYLLGQATRLLLLVPKVSEEDAKNSPDRRTENHGGWQDRREPERKVTPRARPQEPDANVDENPDNAAELRAECERLSKKVKGHLQVSLAEMRKRAKVSTSGTLSPIELDRFVKWCQARLAELEDPEPSDDAPGWMLTSEEGGQS